MLLSNERIDGGGWSSYETVDNFVPEVYFAAEFISTLRKRILFGEQSGVPEVFVLVAHADAVCVFTVEAEAKFVKLWESVDTWDFAVQDYMNMAFVFAVSGIFQIFLLEEREWILVFLNRDNKFLTVLEVAQKGSRINKGFASEERAGRVELLLHFWLFNNFASENVAIERELDIVIKHRGR